MTVLMMKELMMKEHFIDYINKICHMEVLIVYDNDSCCIQGYHKSKSILSACHFPVLLVI